MCHNRSEPDMPIVGQRDDLQGHHHRPHPLGEDEDRDRGDQQPELAEAQGCEHTPPARGFREAFEIQRCAHPSIVAGAGRGVE